MLHVKPSRGRASIGSLTIDLPANLARLSADMAALKPRRTKAAPKQDPFPDLCVAAGLPRPVTEYRFHPTRKWLMDYAIPDLRIALEKNGGVWMKGKGAHSRPTNIVRDMEKSTEAQLLGWIVLSCQPRELHTRGISLLQRAVNARMP